MAVYLHPGVFVEEVSFRSHPIEGVPTSTAGLRGLHERLGVVPPVTPEWSNPRGGDPGVGVLQRFAWLDDVTGWGAQQVSDRPRFAALMRRWGDDAGGGGDAP